MIVTKKSHHFLGLNELILKMYTVLLAWDVFHKLIKESWKKFCVEISSPIIETIKEKYIIWFQLKVHEL